METPIQILQYIGSKARMAGAISRLAPPSCTTYAELYCGSAAVALNIRAFDIKILNDFNPSISNFWQTATNKETSGELFAMLKQTHYSWSDFQRARARCEEHGAKREDKLQWALDTFVLNRQSFNATGGSWTYRDVGQYINSLNKITELPLAMEKLKRENFRIHNANALEVMEQEKLLDNPKAFIFLDPPYLEGLRSDARLYRVDMPDERDHINLLKAIRYAKAKILLSGYWSGRDDGTDLYDYYLLPAGWHRHLLGEYTKGCETGETKSMGAEWIWSNYDFEKEARAGIGGLASYCDEKKSPCIMKWLAVQSGNQN